MKINWKVRLRNKAWLAAVLALIVTFAYDMLAAFEIVPAVSQDWVTGIIGTVLTLLTALGVIIDPTTQGVTDSDRAMTYIEPGEPSEDLQ